ncbi:hypothetical protein E5K00_13875 [Hymenobacter aquaticus]|uniref:M50 family peptidase n=1 Tax=Hymenobacter aquaticus TaxID=1867101 RepID=A0A4Z0PWU9_9BACT|nr:hypothetical protein [Hymenobacter aquaticus]TGE21373.1 hypothetical protein E5K00_13875 [Hymenobacter aquaticus]
MNVLLNPDFELIFRREQDDGDELFFKDRLRGNLLRLSAIEYEIIAYFSEQNSYEQVVRHYAQEFDIDTGFVVQLTNKALETKLLVDDNYQQEKLRRQYTGNQIVNNILSYYLYQLNPLLRRLHLAVVPEFKGNFRFFKLFSVDFTASGFNRLIGRRGVQQGLMAATALLLLGLVAAVAHLLAGISWSEVAAAVAYPGGGWVVPLLVLGTVITSLLHECGHLVVYRRFGGQTSQMGLALLLTVFPAVYVTMDSLYLWDSKRQRFLVTIAGVVVDAVVVAGLLVFLLTRAHGPGAFYAAVLLYITVVRTVTNLNPFIPGTDGYFILADVLGRSALYQECFDASKKCLARVLRGGPAVSGAHVLGLAYIVASVCCISFYYLLFAVALFTPLFLRLL